MVSASSPGLNVANKQLHIAIKKDTDANEKRMVIWVTIWWRFNRLKNPAEIQAENPAETQI